MEATPSSSDVKNPIRDGLFLKIERPCFGLEECQTEVQRDFRSLRHFIATSLRPLVFQWLGDSFGATANLEEIVRTVTRIDDCLEKVIADVLGASGYHYESMWQRAAEVLILRNDRSSLALQLFPFFATCFQHFKALHPILRDDTERNERLDFEPNADELYGRMVYEDRLSSFYECILILCRSRCGLSHLISTAVCATAVRCIIASVDSVLKHTKEIRIEQLKMLEGQVREWMYWFPADSNLKQDSVVDSIMDVVYRLVIDRLMKCLYALCLKDFPSTYRTILSMRYCMVKTGEYGRSNIAGILIEQIEKHLLCISVDTSTILAGYAASVESLKELDPSCVVMHRVCSVIKDYLKRRPDTVRKIITYITTDKRNDLDAQMKKASASGTILDEEEFAGTNDEFLPDAMDLRDWAKWTPDPPDAMPGQSGRFRKSADVFNMLVSVYGSKEMFVKEYRQLLAERLTMTSTRDPIFELRYLELLKMRFSEGELQQCEVMLRDIRESERIDRFARGKQCVPVSACIISSHFWPKFDSEKVEALPEELEKGLELYGDTFKQLKSSRKLNWFRSVGCVEISLELGGVVVERVVNNAQASVLYLFLEKESWEAGEVATRLSVSKTLAKRRLEWWQNQGLLRQDLPKGATAEVWTLVENGSALQNAKQTEEEEDEDEMAIEDAADAVDALEQYWNYTRNYIAQNENGEVKAERMLRIYRMFSSPSAQGPTLETVTAFLMRKVKQGLLTFVNGSFRVVQERT